MQIVADDGVLCHEAGIPLTRNPFAKSYALLGWAWEMGWKEAEFVAANSNRVAA